MPSIKIQIYPNKILPHLRQHPLKTWGPRRNSSHCQGTPPERGHEPMHQSLSYTNPSLRQASWSSLVFCSRSLSYNNIVILGHPVVPSLQITLSLIPLSTGFFTVTDIYIYSAFFNIPVHPDSQYLLIIYLDHYASGLHIKPCLFFRYWDKTWPMWILPITLLYFSILTFFVMLPYWG